MALNWNIERCNNWQELIDDKEWGVTNALIWSTMIVGLSGIDTNNVDEFYARIETVQRATGELCHKDMGTPDDTEPSKWVPYLITRADIVRRIGLGTNASRLSKTEFLKHVKKISTLSDNKIKSLYYGALDSEIKEEVNA